MTTQYSMPQIITLPQTSSINLINSQNALLTGTIILPATHMNNTLTIYGISGEIVTQYTVTYPTQIVMENVNFSRITFQDSNFIYEIQFSYKINQYDPQTYASLYGNANLYTQPIPYTAAPVFAFGSITFGASVYPNQGYYIPITISNTESTATGSAFQQLISFTPSAVSSTINPNCQNIAFYDSNNNKLYSWIENATSATTSGNVYIWVVIPNINPNSSITIYMAIGDTTAINYLGSPANVGAQPNYTATYAQYDNGANIFNFYDNFKGTALASSWTATQFSGSDPTITVNNGLTLSAGGSWCGIYNTYVIPSLPYVIEFYGSESSSGFGGVGTTGANGSQFEIRVGDASPDFGIEKMNGIGVAVSNGVYGGSSSANTLYLVSGYQTTTIQTLLSNYVTIFTNTLTGITTSNLELSHYANAATAFVQFCRTRIYPPDAVMPSITFGTITPTTTNKITILPQNTGIVYFDLYVLNTGTAAVTFQIQNSTTLNYVFDELIPPNVPVLLNNYDTNLSINQQYSYSFTSGVSFFTFSVRETF